MRIAADSVNMTSQRSYNSTTITAQTVQMFTYKVDDTQKNQKNKSFKDLISGEGDESSNTGSKKTGETGSEDSSAWNAFQKKLNSVSAADKINSTQGRDNLAMVRAKAVAYLLQLLFPELADKYGWDDAALEGTDGSSFSGENVYTQTVFFQNYYSYSETEDTQFQTNGTVLTEDGKSISFNMNVEMSRSFQEEYTETYKTQITMCDPLVINLKGNVAGLSDQKFKFDLDADGILDKISKLSSGSGYLALDKNADGIINDGSELFGTSSGNGFKDLSAYDEDKNGWIDENDKIWNKLLIWSKDENGNDVLYHLTEAGLGAICLKNASTEYSLNSSKNNSTNGAIRNTGIFLYENGNVGTIQHLDVAKLDKAT